MRRKAADGMRGWISVVVIVCACALASAASLGGCVFYLNPLCNDQINNGDETGIDCGGPDSACKRCDNGDSCKGDGDCADGTCEGGTCTPFVCANGAQDVGETDVDCGGACRKCAGGRGCAVADDCFNGNCDAGVCSSLMQVSFADAVSYPSGDKTYALFSGDLDSDGDIDLVAANEQGSSLSVFINDGTGVFQRLPNPFPTGDYPTGGVLAYMDHDDKLDVVTANYHGDSVSVLLNLGGGELAEATTYPTQPDGETSNLAVGDLNGDGNLDVIATNPKTASITQFLGQGDGTLAPGLTTSIGIVGAVQPYSVAIGRFDDNETDDVAIADLVNGPVIVRLGNGDGTYQPDVLYPAGGAGGHIIITTDIDLDGDLDLVFASRESNAVAVLLGRGDGTFNKVIRSSTGPVTGPYSIAVADFNLDGVPDVATANFKSNNATVLLGLGDGHFQPAIIAGVTGSSSYGTVAADLNGDGMADIATANANDNNVTVKLNTSQ